MAREYHYGDPDRPPWSKGDPRPGVRRDGRADADLARRIAAEDQRLAGREIASLPSNFLPSGSRSSVTIQWDDPRRAVSNPFPNRTDPAAERLRASSTRTRDRRWPDTRRFQHIERAALSDDDAIRPDDPPRRHRSPLRRLVTRRSEWRMTACTIRAMGRTCIRQAR